MGTEKEALLEKVLNRWKMFNGSQAHAKTTTSVTSNMFVRRWRSAMDLEILHIFKCISSSLSSLAKHSLGCWRTRPIGLTVHEQLLIDGSAWLAVHQQWGRRWAKWVTVGSIWHILKNKNLIYFTRFSIAHLVGCSSDCLRHCQPAFCGHPFGEQCANMRMQWPRVEAGTGEWWHPRCRPLCSEAAGKWNN